jgi:hypothetical protein
MPSAEDCRFTAAYLGFNPHDASTWDADVVNRLARIRSEQGDQAFVQAVANLTTPPDSTLEHWKARALAAEAALAAERERIERAILAAVSSETYACQKRVAAAIRAQGE